MQNDHVVIILNEINKTKKPRRASNQPPGSARISWLFLCDDETPGDVIGLSDRVDGIEEKSGISTRLSDILLQFRLNFRLNEAADVVVSYDDYNFKGHISNAIVFFFDFCVDHNVYSYTSHQSRLTKMQLKIGSGSQVNELLL